MVQVMSRGSMESSISNPVSAGVIFSGGPYCGATDNLGSGSRPMNHHSSPMIASASSGISTMGLLRMNAMARVKELGSFKIPFGMYTSTVSPPRMGSGLL